MTEAYLTATLPHYSLALSFASAVPASTSSSYTTSSRRSSVSSSRSPSPTSPSSDSDDSPSSTPSSSHLPSYASSASPSPAISVSPSPSPSSAASASASFSSSSSPPIPAASGSSPAGPKIGTTTLVVVCVVGTLCVVALCGLLYVCRKRRKQRRSRALVSDERPTRSQRRSVTTQEAFEAVPFPSRLSTLRRPFPQSDSRPSSAWTDDSEMDAMAVAGSSIARTLSNTTSSSRRVESVYSDAPYSSRFPAPPRLAIDTKSLPLDGSEWSTLPSSSNHPYGAHTPQSQAPSYTSDPFADSISPISAPTPRNPSPSQSQIRSHFSPQQQHQFQSQQSYSSTSHLSPSYPASSHNLSRNTTIIRHSDAGRVPQTPSRPLDPVVHLPPTYGELYGIEREEF
ncbi:hypothetical protein P7C73_g1651, partial [Tremellales sp. Uapishka_1]